MPATTTTNIFKGINKSEIKSISEEGKATRKKSFGRFFTRLLATPFSAIGRIAQLASHILKTAFYLFTSIITGLQDESSLRNLKAEAKCTAASLALVAKIPFDIFVKVISLPILLVNPKWEQKISSKAFAFDHVIDKYICDTMNKANEEDYLEQEREGKNYSL